MARLLLTLVGPALLLCGFAAWGADPGVAVPATPVAPDFQYLMTLGPYGALVWGAYLLGKGVRLQIAIELSETDRNLIRKLGGEGKEKE